MSLLIIFPTNADPVTAARDLGDVLVEACLSHCKLVISTVIAHMENRARKIAADQKHFDMDLEHPIVQWAYSDMNHLWWLISYYDAARSVFSNIPGRNEDVAIEHADECHRIARWWAEQGFQEAQYSRSIWNHVIKEMPFQAPSGLCYGGDAIDISRRWLALGPQRNLQSWWSVKEVPDWWIDIRLSVEFHPQTDRHGVEVWEEHGEIRVDLMPLKAVRIALKVIPEIVKATRSDQHNGSERECRAVSDIRNKLREQWHTLVLASYPALALKNEAESMHELLMALNDLTGSVNDHGLFHWLGELNWIPTYQK